MSNVPWNEIITKLEAAGHTLTDWARAGAEYAYPLAVQKVVTGAWIEIWIGIAFAILLIASIIRSFLDGLDDDSVWFMGIIGFAGAIAFIGFGIYRQINAQWYAIQEVLALIKP